MVHGYLLWRHGQMQLYISRGRKHLHQHEPLQPGVQQAWNCQLLPQNPLWTQARFLKEKTKCFVGFWHRRSLLQRSGRHSALFSRLGGQCLMLAGASVRYELITCCWFIVSLAGSTVNWTIVEDTLNWFCSGFTGGMSNCKAPVKYFHRSGEFTFRGFV